MQTRGQGGSACGQNLLAAVLVRERDPDHAVEAPGARERLVQHIEAVRGRDHHHGVALRAKRRGLADARAQGYCMGVVGGRGGG